MHHLRLLNQPRVQQQQLPPLRQPRPQEQQLPPLLQARAQPLLRQHAQTLTQRRSCGCCQKNLRSCEWWRGSSRYLGKMRRSGERVLGYGLREILELLFSPFDQNSVLAQSEKTHPANHCRFLTRWLSRSLPDQLDYLKSIRLIHVSPSLPPCLSWQFFFFSNTFLFHS